MRSHWWTVTSCLCLIGTQSRASEHKRPREGLVRLSVYGPGKPVKSEEVKKRKEKMQEERRLEEKGAREEERVKREVEEEQGGSQEKKRKVVEQAPPSYWDWLPPELKEDVEKKALYGLIQE